MEMSMVLQVALFLASLAVIVLVACVVPLAFKTRQNSDKLLQHIEDLKATTLTLASDTRELVRNLNALTQRTTQQMDDLGQVVQTVRHWTQRADRVVAEVGSAVEPTLFAAIRNIKILRQGLKTFLHSLLHHDKIKPNNQEHDHVRI